MRRKFGKLCGSSLAGLCALATLSPGACLLLAQDVKPDPGAPGMSQGFVDNYSKVPGIFPRFWRPYEQQDIPLPMLENSPRLDSLIHNGKLELSLADAIALTIENNLDIVVSRYVIPFSQTDILRTRSGQAARGFTGGLLPGELNSGAIGAGVTSTGSTGGTGNAGGITGGGGAVSIGSAGAFDPTVNFGFSFDRVTSPLNSVVVSGVPTTTSYATAFSGSYAQLFTTGASYSVSLSALRQSTTQKNTLYNPDVTSRLSIGFNQPILAGFGRLANERFMLVARTNQTTAQDVFKLQVITSVAQLENAYWDYAAFQENVRVAEESLSAAKELVEETRKQEQIGTMSRLDLVTAESQVAASQRDLIVAQTNLQQQETNLKQLVSKKGDKLLDAATVVTTDALPEPRDTDLPSLTAALESAARNRPEIHEATNNLANQDIAIQYTRNNQKPSLSVFGLYASSGLQGNTAITTSGALGSLNQAFGAAYPETAAGLSFGASIRNRSAQADSIRAQLERNQLEVQMQGTRNTINVGVRQAFVALIQGKAQVQASHEAVRLAQLTLDAERKKLEIGASTSYNVVLRERDLVTAQYAEVQALDAYAKALVAIGQSMGDTLERNGIQLDDALKGTVVNLPSPFRSQARPGVVKTPGGAQK
ncbi:MAG TPA: TolC family protein [Bryobacteraceae bacterium]|nr:TolC family protein [Bryobacteraceae bacterium]